jgi:hypothetical protein
MVNRAAAQDVYNTFFGVTLSAPKSAQTRRPESCVELKKERKNGVASNRLTRGEKSVHAATDLSILFKEREALLHVRLITLHTITAA